MKITIEGTNKNGRPFDATYHIDDQLLRMARSPVAFALEEVRAGLTDAIDRCVMDNSPNPAGAE